MTTTDSQSPFADQAGVLTRLFADDAVFREQAYETLRPVSLGLAIAFTFFVILGFIDRGPGGLRQALIVGTDLLTAVFYLVCYRLLCQGSLTINATSIISVVYVVLATANVLLAFWLTEQAFFLTYLPIVVLGCGAFMLSLPLLIVAFVVVCLMSSVVALDVIPAMTLVGFLPALMGGFLVSVLILAVRRWHVIESRRAILAMEAEALERQRAEEHLAHAQRLESIGKLVSGIAHDFNNLLMVIIGYTDSLIEEQKNGGPAEDDLKVIRNAGENAAALAARLLAFSRQQVMKLETVPANRLIRDVEPLVTRSLPGHIRFSTDLAADAGMVRVDQLQMQQVLINLALNARDAIGESEGEITIMTRRTEDAGRQFLEISVVDNGEGIPDAVRQHMFEPFYTTRATDGGTGLGLAMVHGIVTQSQGQIEVETERGQGTTFRVTLPAVSDELPPEQQGGSAIAHDLEGLRVLVVDDEKGVRDIVARTLDRHGCKVTSSVSGEEAMQLLASSELDFVVTDVVMPGMSGTDLVSAMRTAGHHQAVLLMSGHTGDNMLPSEAGALRLLRKPFGSEELIDAVVAVVRAASR